MNITFVSADETIMMTFGVNPWTAVKDITKVEKELGKDLTDIIQKVIDVAFRVTSPTFTRGPKDAYVVSYSWELQPIVGESVTEDNAVKSITVTVGDSDRNLYEFEDVEERDVDVMIMWLRRAHNVYYSPNDELLNEKKKWATKAAEQQKKIDSYEATLSKITDIMKPDYAGPAWSETWDDLVERIKRMKEKAESLEEIASLKKKVEDLKRKFAAKDTNIRDLNNINAALSKDKKDLSKFRSDIMGVLFGGVPCASFDENSKNAIDIMKALREFRKEVIKRAGVNESETSDDYILKSLDIKLDHSASSRFIDKVYELAGCGRYSYTLDDVIEHLEAGLDDARGLSLKIEELEEEKASLNSQLNTYSDFVRDTLTALGISGARDYSETRRRIETLRDGYDSCKDWSYALQKLYTDIFDLAEDDWDVNDPPSVFADKILRRFKELKIKLKNYETENRLLLERNHALSASNGAMDVLRNLHGSVIGLCDIDDCPQIIGARIIDKFDRVKAEKEELKTAYARAKCAQAELRYLYSKIVGFAARDDMSMHEMSVCIHSKYKNTFQRGAKYCDRMRELEQKLEDIKNICDSDSDILNIIGE